MPNNEAKYEGTFFENRFQEGRLTYLNLNTDCWFEGTFDENNQFKKGTYQKGPATYVGSFQGQKMVGNFKVTWQSGIKYEGQVQENKLHGDGEMTFPEGYNIKHIKGVWAAD